VLGKDETDARSSPTWGPERVIRRGQGQKISNKQSAGRIERILGRNDTPERLVHKKSETEDGLAAILSGWKKGKVLDKKAGESTVREVTLKSRPKKKRCIGKTSRKFGTE